MKTIALIDTRSEIPGVSLTLVSTHPDMMAGFAGNEASRRPRPAAATSVPSR